MTLTLTGYVPDNTIHAALAAARGAQILQRKGGRQSQGQHRRALRIRERRGAGAGRAVAAVDRHAGGVRPGGQASGDACTRAAVQIRAGLGKDFPQGWQFKAEISVKPAAAPVDATVCQQLFSDLGQGQNPLRTARATLDPDSAALLDRLIEIALRCPAANIEIAGHTDGDGEDAFNQTLSEKRAQAVAIIWSRPDCRRTVSRAVGYGSRQPVASTRPTKARRETAASNSR